MRSGGLKSVVIAGVAILVLGLGVLAVRSAAAPSAEWALKGTWSDTCSCKVSCPCFFGSGPTEDVCEGSSLIEIDQGHYRGVKLDGTAAVVSYSAGKWTRIYVSDEASPEQVDAFAALVPLAVPFLGGGPVETVDVVPLAVERTAEALKYSAPESEVEIEVVVGPDGEPVKLVNLPVKGMPFPAGDHTQYKSVHSRHHSEAHQFEWSGRNGFVSDLDVSGKLPADS